MHSRATILKTVKNMKKVKANPCENLTTVKVVLSRIKHEGNSFAYQGADLKEFDEAVAFFKANHSQYSDLVHASRIGLSTSPRPSSGSM